MTRFTFQLGAVLAAVGVVAYAVTAAASATALIPAVVGLLLIGCAALTRRPGWHRHGLHAALAVALLAALGSLTNVLQIGEVVAGTAERPTAVVVSTIMFVLLLGYLAAGVRSFVAARRDRSTAG